jgi:UDP-N-acetylmuramate dehydrogenase
MKIRENVPISTLTTMRLGGPARYVITITDPDDIRPAYAFASEHKLPVIVLGGGSNFIGRDEGFDGVILLNQLHGITVVSQTDTTVSIRAMSGEILDDLCAFSAAQGLSGIEMMSAIPGTVGAAPVQNSGAYGQDTSHTLTHIEVYDRQDDQIKTLPIRDLSEFDFSYRHSVFNSADKDRYFIIAVTFELHHTESQPPYFASLQAYLDQHGISARDPATLRAAVIDIRAHKLPDPTQIASAGSFFKNIILTPAKEKALRAKYPDAPIFPVNGEITLASGWLIEQAGLKGKTFHGMTVNDQAALILMNTGAKSYADLAAARAEIIATVKAKFGITLTQEPEEI